MDLRKVWDSRADEWKDWARTPGHDSYWYYSPAFFDEIVPPGPAFTLDLGCGEGRAARDLTDRGHTVIGLDSSETLIRHAHAAGPTSIFVIGDATAEPFSDGSFDLVVAYNSLMDLNDLEAGVSEAARLLRPGGRLCICVVHPVRDAGHFTSENPDSDFVISGSYLESRRYDETFERVGLPMTFSSWRYSIERYARALEEAGMLIELLREPPPDPAVRT